MYLLELQIPVRTALQPRRETFLVTLTLIYHCLRECCTSLIPCSQKVLREHDSTSAACARTGFRDFFGLARCGESAVASRWLCAQGPTGSLWNRLWEEGRQVSWAATVMAATAPSAGVSAPEAAASTEAPLQYSLLLQHLVGDKRQPRVLEPGTLGGIPSPAKSEEQKMIERAMESCAFKAALACVGGEAR